jgi:hypothetical protein
MGGIGNQLFQYAAGRALSQKHAVDLALDVSFLERRFENVTPREYALGAFNIAERFATAADVAALTYREPGVVSAAKRVVSRLGPRNGRREFFETSSRYDPGFKRLGGSVYLGGYFQSEKYFYTVAPLLRREIQLRTPLSSSAGKIADSIRAQGTPVSIHMRRGDYVTNPAAATHHGVLPAQYFQQAVATVKDRVRDPHFFVFSDEPDWAESYVGIDDPVTIVRGEGKADAEDIMLISMCRHHIISNSSFSWWGAWLSAAEGKVVIAPKRWFASESEDSSDIVPPGWLRI